MKIDLKIAIDVDADGDEEVEERALELAAEEGRKYAAALTDRLEAEGVTNIQVRLDED